jgi:hypothetical protein
VQVDRQPVIDGAAPVGAGQHGGLRVGDRHEGKVSVFVEHRLHARQIEATVLRGDVRDGEPPGERKVQVGQVEVHDVEVRSALQHALELQHLRRNLVPAVGIQPQRLLPDTDELGVADGVARSEEGHVVTHAHELVG